MQAVARHDVGRATEDIAGKCFHIHQFEETQLSFFIVKEQINVRIRGGITSCDRAEQVQMLDTEPFQVGLVPPQLGYDFLALHVSNIVDSSFSFHGHNKVVHISGANMP